MNTTQRSSRSPRRDWHKAIATFLRDETTHPLSGKVTLSTVLLIVLMACGARLVM